MRVLGFQLGTFENKSVVQAGSISTRMTLSQRENIVDHDWQATLSSRLSQSAIVTLQTNMAGVAADASRMGVTLQGYNQVIALSQANINETLRRHFSILDAEDELGLFKSKGGPASINAKVLAPKIELIDKDDGDCALYIVRLGEGVFKAVNMDGDDIEVIQVPTDGWELAFDVDFAFKPAKKIPENIEQQVPLPGGYSVKQLMINFGDATRIFQLNPDRSKFPVNDKDKAKINASNLKVALQMFTGTYLEDKLKAADSHNILGYAVELNEKPKDLKPTFIPTACKVQIVGHRVGGDAKSFRQDSPYNAFCFTEMTEWRTMPGTEIKYSGNWFYESIGGTMAISRSTFWDLFMVPKIKDAHVKAVESSHDIINLMAGPYFKGNAWYLDNSKPSRDQLCAPFAKPSELPALAFGATYQCSNLEHWNKEESTVANFFFKPRSTISTTAAPSKRKGEIVFNQDVDVSWEQGVKLSNYFYVNPVTALVAAAFNVNISGSIGLTIKTTISFKAVTSTGDLQVESKSELTREKYDELKIRIGGVGSYLPDDFQKKMNELGEDASADYKQAKKTLSDWVKSRHQVFTNVADEIQKGLNNGNKFVFPGNGTFDMKDPLFSDEGNLMVGLAYR